jgi:hypothetical protein
VFNISIAVAHLRDAAGQRAKEMLLLHCKPERAVEESEAVAGLVAVDRRDVIRHFHLTEQKEAK